MKRIVKALGLAGVFSMMACGAVAQTNDSVLAPRIMPLQGTERLDEPADTLFSNARRTENVLRADSISVKKVKRDWATWRPDAKRALWLALVIPGAGQIYNRKYWKLPLVYGGFMGCIYAMRWNNMMYKDYAQAYLDIMDSDPTTQSYNQFLHLGNKITEANMARYQNIFKQRKDRYRRWRDLSFFCMVGVYALSVIDAYVDASLSEFDISNDLSLRVSPTVIDSNRLGNRWNNTGIGVQCSLNF